MEAPNSLKARYSSRSPLQYTNPSLNSSFRAPNSSTSFKLEVPQEEGFSPSHRHLGLCSMEAPNSPKARYNSRFPLRHTCLLEFNIRSCTIGF